MKRRLVVEFTKMSGNGNDFIVIDNRFYHFTADEIAAWAPRVCQRRHGVGADGILALEASANGSTAFKMLYYNADGTEGTMCANGARCLVRYAVGCGLSPGRLRFDTASGPCAAIVPEDPTADVRLFVGQPRHWIPQHRVAQALPEGISGLHYLWTGTEHVVCLVDDVEKTPVPRWGRAIRRDEALAPAGANVNFVSVTGAARLAVRTYEKGVEAETLACGTGALASALAVRYLGYQQADEVIIRMPGGELKAGLAEPLFLEGPAATIFRGSFEL